MIQGSDEWHAARLGCVTASRIADLAARTKSGLWSASRDNYRIELVLERLTGRATEHYTNSAMEWGTETEPEARRRYAGLNLDVDVVEAGFIPHPSIDHAGASPDGLVGDDGLLEIKCPQSKAHLDALLGAPIADRYVKQMLWQMACTCRQWCDFVSFDPRFPEAAQIDVRRVERDDVAIAQLEELVVAFLNDVDATISSLALRVGVKPAIPSETLKEKLARDPSIILGAG